MATIKFYSNYKNKKFYVSGKNEKNKWFSLWKNPDFNNELYLDTQKFKGGVEIDKSKLKLLPNDSGEESKVLVFKNAEDEKEFCIDKVEIEKRKQERTKKKQSVNNDFCEFVVDMFRDLFKENNELKVGEVIRKQFEEYTKVDLEEIEVDEEDLPF